MIALILPNLTPWVGVLLPFMLAVAALGLGWQLALHWSRRRLDQEMSRSFARQLPQIRMLERAARTPDVDRVAKRYQRTQHRAAFVDIVLQGREVTLVAADRAHLQKAAFAIQKNHGLLEGDMLHAPEPPPDPEPKKFKAPEIQNPPAPPSLKVLEGGKP